MASVTRLQTAVDVKPSSMPATLPGCFDVKILALTIVAVPNGVGS